MQEVGTNALEETLKSEDNRINKETELRNKQAELEQSVRGRNAQARNAYAQKIAEIKNAEIEANRNINMSKAQTIGNMFNGIAQAVNNGITQAQQRAADDRAMGIQLATARPGVAERLAASGYLNDRLTQGIYNTIGANLPENIVRPNSADYAKGTDDVAYKQAFKSYKDSVEDYNNKINMLNSIGTVLRGRHRKNPLYSRVYSPISIG
jgi:hypothetical protein